MKPPIFIIGSPRSGTTLLRLMLTCHRNVIVPPECGFAVWLWPRYEHWPIDDEPGLIERFVDDVMECRKMETWELSPQRLRQFLLDDPPPTYAAAVASVYLCYGRARGRDFHRWGDKNNFYLDHVATLRALFPDAYFVHIVRDGRNVACSYRRLNEIGLEARYAPRLPSAVDEIARQWQANIATIRASLAEVDPQQVLELRFQDLTNQPKRELTRLCLAFGEPYDPGMLDYHSRNRHEGLEPRDFLAWKEKTLQPLQPETADHFRTLLSRDEIQTFEAIAGDALRAYDFSIS